MKWGGMSEDEAFAMVTINPARQLRIDSRVGSLEPGKDADVVIWNHHPLSSYAIAERVYIEGAVYYDRKGEEGRLTALKKEKSTLAAAEDGTRPATTAPQENPRATGRDSEAGSPEDARQGGPRGDEEGTPSTHGWPTPAERTAAQGAKPVAASAGAVVAITNARIHPITRPTIERGTIVLRGAKIEALGAGIPVPAGATVVDAAGADVYPGFINARTQMGLNEPGPRGFEDVNEMLDLNPQLQDTHRISLGERRHRGRAHQRRYVCRGHAWRRPVWW